MRKRSCLLMLGLLAGCTTPARSVVDSPEALRLEQTCEAALAFTREPLRTRDQKKIEGPKIVAACQEALNLGLSSPRAGKANLCLGVIQQHLGTIDASEKPLREAIRLGSDGPEAQSALATVLFVRGLDVARSGQADSAKALMMEALARVERAARSKPDDGDIQWLRGDCLWELQRQDEAVLAYRAAVAAEPHNLDREIQLAKTLNKLNRHAEAVAVFESVARAQPEALEGPGSAKEILEASRRGKRWPGWDSEARLVP
jgi:tetratricopeptide (TPR) repeat protein